MVNDCKNLQTECCTILLATHNGVNWLNEQLESIYAQTDVDIHIVANDDSSTDGTLKILNRWSKSHNLDILASANLILGSPNRNFLHLIINSNISNSDFVALSDQDDIWKPEKIRHAIDVLNKTEVSAYSSNVEAFWANGKSIILKKSHKQRRLDYLFSSPGPGCTFVFRRNLFLEIRAWVTKNIEVLSGLWVHDWILYAYVRGAGHRWIIDDFVSMRYRQHATNSIGANNGLTALKSRWIRLRSGQFHRDALAISRIANQPQTFIARIERLKFWDRLYLIGNAHHFRRKLKDIIALTIAFMIMKSIYK